ncbi:unnamed protein product [Caenorhabditis angaria]|uniref:Uncharacterized protein n=1 Tax=Caenorhabditis angaria TaxID=860376 RepID=A0A9P1N7Q0_9PELO|nr:unnamed protein product [Caenorhabditis angaria]
MPHQHSKKHRHSGRSSSRSKRESSRRREIRGETPPGEEDDEHRMELIDKTVELRGSQILNMNSYHAIVWRRRFMAFATLLAWIGVGIYSIAVATSHWQHISFWNSHSQKVHVDLGVWGEWRTIDIWSGPKVVYQVDWIPHFPTPENIPRLSEADLKNYYYSQIFMVAIALVLYIGTNLLAIYTFYHHRYMYKRVVACLWIVVAMCIYATIEIVASTIEEWKTDMRNKEREINFTSEANRSSGYSTRLAQVTMGICVFGAICFALGSHKQKGENAATAELEIEDREYHIGR